MHRRPLVLAGALVSLAFGRQHPDLRKQIAILAATAQGKVSDACSLPRSDLNCDLNPAAKPPMQSVFKLPLAVMALHLVEQGRLSLDQSIRFGPEDRILPQTYSPLQDKYPAADVEIPLRDLLRMTVSLSDNVAADIVLRVVGGPSALNDYVNGLGFSGFHIEDDEANLHRDVTAQYRNWFQPNTAVQLLLQLVENRLLTAEHSRLVLTWMRDTPRAAKRIKGLLPADTVVMHKPGTSGTDHGVTHATNDIGLVLLPDGRYLAIAVYVTDSRADETTRDQVIARIAKAVYHAAVE